MEGTGAETTAAKPRVTPWDVRYIAGEIESRVTDVRRLRLDLVDEDPENIVVVALAGTEDLLQSAEGHLRHAARVLEEQQGPEGASRIGDPR